MNSVEKTAKKQSELEKTAIHYTEKNRIAIKCCVLMFAISGMKNAGCLLNIKIKDYAEQYGAFSVLTSPFIKALFPAVFCLIFEFVLFSCLISKISDAVSYIAGDIPKDKSDVRTGKAIITGTLPVAVCVLCGLIFTVIVNNVNTDTLGNFTKAVIVLSFSAVYFLLAFAFAVLISALIMLVYLSNECREEELSALYAFSLSKSVTNGFPMLFSLLKLLPPAFLSLLLPLFFLPFTVKKAIYISSVTAYRGLLTEKSKPEDKKEIVKSRLHETNLTQTIET